MEIRFKNKITNEERIFTNLKELNKFMNSIVLSVFQDMIKNAVNENIIVEFCQNPNYKLIDKYSSEWKILSEDFAASDIQEYLEEHQSRIRNADILEQKRNSENKDKKRANGTGSAVYLGNRGVHSWAARLTIGKKSDGTPVYYDLDTFPTKLDAVVCLENYKSNRVPLKILESKYNTIVTFPPKPYPLVPVKNKSSDIHRKDKSNYTFKQVYEELKEKCFPTQEERFREYKYHIRADGKLGVHHTNNMINAFHKCSELYDKIYRELTTSDFNDFLVRLGKSKATTKNIKILFNTMDNYAYGEKIIYQKFADGIIFKGIDTPTNKRECFSYEQIEYLWNIQPEDYRDQAVKDVLLLTLYTGARADEILTAYNSNVHLEENYFVTGEKTQAGKNRIIPIHHRIKPIFERLYNSENEFLFTQSNGNKLMYRTYNMWYNDIFIGKHTILKGQTAHCARHTLETELQRLNIKKTIINAIIGHKNGDIGSDVYNHISLQEMFDAINLVTYKDTRIYILNSERKTS